MGFTAQQMFTAYWETRINLRLATALKRKTASNNFRIVARTAGLVQCKMSLFGKDVCLALAFPKAPGHVGWSSLSFPGERDASSPGERDASSREGEVLDLD